MNTLTAEQVGRLPKWAQQHVIDCERRMHNAEAKLRQFIDDKPKSNVYMKCHTLDIGDKVFLPTDEVTFILGERAEINIRLDEGLLHCMGSGSARTALVVKPRVTNVINLLLE